MKTIYFAAFLALSQWTVAQELNNDESLRTKQIQEVALKKKWVQKKSDRLVYNVGSIPIAKGSNGFELLKQTPMVSTTDEKNLKVLGKNAVSIYINGKKQNMEVEAVMDMLKNMPAENISKIEVITVPSAEFQVEGNEAIINIILKKNTTDGISGNAKLENIQAKSNSSNGSVSVNYRKGKFGLQTNLNASLYNRDQHYILTNGNLGGNQPFSLTSEGDVTNKENKWGGYLNANYDLSENHKLDFSYQYRRKSDDPAKTRFYNEMKDLNSGLIVDRTRTENDMTAKNDNHSINLGYEWKTDAEGSLFSANLSYLNFDKIEKNNSSTLLLDPQQQTLGFLKQFYQNTPLEIDNYGIKTDYILKLKNEQSIGLGLSYNYTKTDSDALVYNILPPTGKDDNQSNHFVYDEKIWSAYATWDKKWNEKVTSKLGVRYENTSAEGNVLDKNMTINRNDGNWLPFLSVNYAANDNHQLSYHFSSRVRRPSFWALNPVKIYLTANNYIQNNPFTQAEQFYNSELQYMYKGTYFFTFSYNYTDNAAEQVPLSGTKNDGSGDRVLAYIRTNYGNKQELSWSLGMQKQFFDGIWTTSNSLVLGYNRYRGFVGGDPSDAQHLISFDGKNMNNQSTYFQAQLNNSLRLSPQKDWYLGMNYFYISPIQVEVGRLKSFQSLNLSLKKIYKNWTFNAEVQDVFGTNKNYITNQDDFGNFSIVDQNQYNRRLILGVIYNFGNQKVKKVKKMETANDEIKNRTN